MDMIKQHIWCIVHYSTAVRPSDVAGTSQMKHPTTSQWNFAKTSQWCVSTTSYWNVITTSQKDVTTTPHHYVSTTSQTSLKWNTQRRLSGTLPRCLSVMYPWGPISTSLRRLLKLPNETPSNVAVVRLHHTSKLCCRDALSLLQSLLRFQITLSWPLSGRFSRLI